jgi:CBS domain-containing protein
MRCETVMKQEVAYVMTDDSVQEAAFIMRDQNVGFLPVCDNRGRVVGTLTDRDLAVRVVADALDVTTTLVGRVMTHELVSCRPEDELTDAERLMATHRKSRIVITDEADHLIGVISLSDVVTRDSNKHAAHTLRKIVERELH